MIESVHFRNFKALRAVDLRLERLTVFVGPNASGKTSVLEGIYYLSQLAFMAPEKLFQDARDPANLWSRGGEPWFEIEMKGHWEGEPIRLQLRAGEPTGKPPPKRKASYDFEVTGSQGDAEVSAVAPTGRRRNLPLPSATLLRLDATRLAGPAYSDSPVPQIARDGSGLAAVLAELAVTAPERFAALQEALRAVVPQVRRVRLRRAKVVRPEVETHTIDGAPVSREVERTYWGHEILLDMQGGSDIPAHAASEGTLLVLGLLTAIMGPSPADIVMLDDLERALHPRALADLVAQLRRLLDAHPELQLLVTSHSPYLIDQFRPEEVRLHTLDDTGAVVCAALHEHPDFERWKDEMLPGEFWSLVGEDWVRQLRSPSYE